MAGEDVFDPTLIGEPPSDNGGFSFLSPSGDMPDMSMSGVTGNTDWTSILKSIAPLLGAGAGTLGPIAGLIGNLASGGQGPTSNQANTSASNTFGTTNQANTGQTTGFNNTTGTAAGTSTPTLLPQFTGGWEALMGGLGNMNAANAPLYGQGAGLLSAIGQGAGTEGTRQAIGGLGAMNVGGGANPLAGLSATPGYSGGAGPAQGGTGGNQYIAGAANVAVPNATPTSPFPEFTGTLDPAVQALIQKTYEPLVGNVVEQAIEQARARGFSGGGDLLRTAANPLASRMLADLPGQQANSILQMMMAIPALQNTIATSKNAAELGVSNANINAAGTRGNIAANAANAQNAANQVLNNAAANTNQFTLGQGALQNAAAQNANQFNLGAAGLGVNRELGLGQLDLSRLSTMGNLGLGQGNLGVNVANALMAPANQNVNQMLAALGLLPHGTETMGTTTNQGMSGGTTASNTMSNTTGGTSGMSNATGTATTPLGSLIGTGLNQAILGGASGLNAGLNMNNPNNSLIALLNALNARG